MRSITASGVFLLICLIVPLCHARDGYKLRQERIRQHKEQLKRQQNAQNGEFVKGKSKKIK
jgi:hypothetical protein